MILSLARHLLLGILVAGFLVPAARGEEIEGLKLFEAKIRPVLIAHCYQCHSAQNESPAGNLRLDTRQGWQQGGDSGTLLVPGKPRESQLLSALQYDGLEMPPKGQLPPQVIADFERWIELGTPDPRNGEATAETDWQQRSQHWSLQPIADPQPPVASSNWPTSDIDRFIAHRLEEEGIEPVADADRLTLLRRVWFDLIGLPPTVKAQRAFLADQSPDAFARVVDDLLASPHFGERWGRHWLDLVRYSESNGGDRNVIWQHAWRYRRYVIQAFNADKPYDVFLQEQIAGDLLEAETSEQRDQQWIATGMLTLGAKLFMETDSEQFRMDRVDEQIDVVSQSILGLTVSCARCHDHKFDAVRTADYYALAGIFRSTYLLTGTAAPAGNQYGHDRPLQPIGADGEELQGPALAWKQQVADKTAERNKARSDRYRIVRAKQSAENKLSMLNKDKSDVEQQADEAIAQLKAEIDQQAAEIEDWDAKIAKLDEELKSIEENPPPLPDYCMAVRDDETIEDCRICIAGNVKQRGMAVPRGPLSASAFPQAEAISADQSGRLQLAQWLTDPQHPLVARVWANRIWQRLFGQGLVSSVDNFGRTGEPPSHPQLLDYLARTLQRDGWSSKQLIRRILLSRAYQLSSRPYPEAVQRDPDNRLLWRQNPRRLEVEPLRDAILAVSGMLDPQPPAASPLAGYEEVELNAKVLIDPEDVSLPVRTIYLPVARFHLPEMLETFDYADPTLVVGKRSERTMAAQQLFFLNNPWLLEMVTATAARLEQDAPADADRVELAYRRCFGRPPTSQQRAAAFAFLDQESAAQSSSIAWQRFVQALLASAEFRIID